MKSTKLRTFRVLNSLHIIERKVHFFQFFGNPFEYANEQMYFDTAHLCICDSERGSDSGLTSHNLSGHIAQDIYI